MIRPIAETVATNRHMLGDVLLGTSGGSFVLGITVATLNQYLQMGAFIVSMFAGICAGVYYIVMIQKKRKSSED